MSESSLRDAINETSGTAVDTLSKALARAGEESWRGVVILALASDNGARFLKSASLNDMERLIWKRINKPNPFSSFDTNRSIGSTTIPNATSACFTR